MALILGLALAIGLLLGLLGGGGSILTVPLLVYVAGLEPKAAMASSLVVVGITSLTALAGHARSGRVCWRTGFLFGAAGMIGAYGGGRMAAFVPGGILLLVFAALMTATAVVMLRGRKEPRTDAVRQSMPCPAKLPILPILFDGLAVGALTGLVGAGGGFLVVPALNLLGGLPMHAAVGTSLLVIALKSFAALAGYASHLSLDLELTGAVTAAAVAGSALGGRLSRRVAPHVLRRGFAVFVMAVAGYLLYRELTPAVIAEAWRTAVAHREFLWGTATVLVAGWLYRLRAKLASPGPIAGPDASTGETGGGSRVRQARARRFPSLAHSKVNVAGVRPRP